MRADSSGRSSAAYIGRVGALAVALGVGSAVMGLTAVAVADPGTGTGPDNTAGSAGQESAASGNPADTTARGRNGNRAGSATTPAPSAAAGRRAGTARSGQAAAVTPTGSAGTPAVSIPQSPVDLIGALLTPGGMSNLVQQTLTSLIADIFAAVPADILAPDAAVTPEITAVPSPDVALTDEPPVMTAQTDTMSATDSTALNELGDGTGDPLAAPLAWAAVAVSQRETLPGTSEVVPAASVTTGEPVDLTTTATQYQNFLDLPGPAIDWTRTELRDYRPTIVNNIAQSFATAFNLGTIADADKCVKDKGCPAPLSVSNAVGMYGFNVVYALMGDLPAAKTASTVQQFASQPVILDFIASTVAANISANNPNVPPAVANLFGTAAKTFVLNTFGNTKGPSPNYVALQFVPFLQALNLPTTGPAATDFLLILKKGDPNAEILKRFNPTQRVIGQQKLVSFFSNGTVQGYLDSAFTESIKVLLVPTMADYIGGNVATGILGAGNANIPTLSATIGTALSGLFSSIGEVVATQAGNAFGTFLNAPGQNIPTVLANAMVNGFVAYLSPKDKKPDLPFPQGDLGPLIAPAAGVATDSFVKAVLTNAAVPPAVTQFINAVIPGTLANPGVQQVLGDRAGDAVTKLLGDDALAAAVGNQVGIAVANLAAVPVVQTAVTTWTNSLVTTMITTPQVVAALATAAGGLVSVDLTYGPATSDAKSAAQQAIIGDLRKTPAIDTAVNQAVSSGVTALFSNPDLLAAMNSAAVSLVTSLLGDSAVQQGLSTRVSTEVAKLFGGSAFGQAVGAQAGAAVVTLLNNSAIRNGLVGLVDTMVTDFFSVQGVVPVIATAAGQLAAAEVADNVAAVLPDVQAALRASLAIQQGVSLAVGNAARTLLTTPDFLAALDHTASSLVAALLADPSVESSLSTTVAKDVSEAFGGGALGQAVGAQVGAAVAGLLSQQAVQNALAGLVDTELGDFFRSDGVVDAFVVAADTFALETLTGNGANAAADARKSLQASTAIQGAVGTIVTKSVAELLGDSALWSAFDASAARLVGGLLADPSVQSSVSDRVYLAVWTALNGTTLAVAVADQVSTAVVDLMKNPNISAGLVGVVDTVLGDFFRTDGVVTAFSTAAGQLASASVAGTLPATEKQVQAELRANTAVQLGVDTAVGNAVTSLLTNQSVVSALNDRLASLMSDLLGDPDVQAGLDEGVSKSVSDLLGGGAFGDAVGAQAGTAVVEILSNPIVKDALEGLVDTELGDFFRTQGVVAAFASAADTFALDVLTGTRVNVAAEIAVKQLRTSPAVDTAVQQIVTTTVSEFLGNQEVWEAVDGTASRLVADLLADPDVQQAVAGKVYANVWVAFNGTALGQVVGDEVAAAVVALMQNPSVAVGLVGLVDTVTSDFFGYPGVVAAFSTAAGELAAAEVAGDIKTVAPVVQAELRANPDVEQAAGVAVGDAVETLLTDEAVLSALDKTAAGVVTDLLADPTVQAKLNEQIVKEVSKAVGGGDLGQAVGTQVAATVDTFLSNPSVRVALVGLVDDELGNFFRSAGVVSAFSEAADMFAIEVVTGENVKTAADDATTWLRNSAPVQDAVIGVITESVGALLSNSYVIQAADNGLTTLLTNLGPYAGQLVTLFVTESMKESPIAEPVGQALGAAVEQLLTVPGFGSGVVTIIASALPDFLGQFGVPEAVAGVVGDYAAALVAGEDPAVARQNAEEALRTNPTIDSAEKATVADSLILANLNLLSNPAIQAALGTTTTTLITTLAADPTVQAFIAQRDNPALAELLANTAVLGEVAPVVGSVVTQLLGYPGFNTALLDAVNQFADDLIDGQETSYAEQHALQTLRSAPATVSAVRSVVPPAVNTLLAFSNVRQALGLYADEETVAYLQRFGINNRFLDRTFGQVTDGTVESLLTRTAGLTLADNLVVNVVLGMPIKDWRSFTAQEVIADPFLQIAFGMSLGHGIGSLFGDNVFGELIGVAAAVPATLGVVISSAIVGFFEWIFGRPSVGVIPSAAAEDLPVWRATVLDLGAIGLRLPVPA